MRFIFLTFLIFAGLISAGQKKYKPTILVLDPYQTTYDTTLLPEILEYTYRLDFTPEEEKHILDSLNDNEPNIRIMDVAEFHYRKERNFASTFTLSLYGMLTYMVFGQTENCIVIPSHDKSNGSTETLKSLAKKHNAQWVVNPVSFMTFFDNGNMFSKARLQVYNYQKNKIVLDKEYTGGTKNPGFELSCETGSLECTINNIINPSLHDILLTILKSYQH
jgi:hypothetical protein